MTISTSKLYITFILSFVFWGILFSCEPKKKSEKGDSLLVKRIVKGRIDAAFQKGVILLYRVEKDGETLIDTVDLQPSGRFYVAFNSVGAEVCRLDFFTEKSVIFVAVEETTDIQVRHFEKEAFFNFKRSLENKAFQELQTLKKQVFTQRQRLRKQGKLGLYGKEIDKSVIEFIEENQAFYASLLALELLNVAENRAYFTEQIEIHKPRFGLTNVWQSINQQLTPFQRLAEVGTAPIFSLPDLQDSLLHLSDFKGRKVLLSFWANWCLQCPEIKEQLNEWQQIKFKNSDSLIILHISLDANKNLWKKEAMKMQKLKQIHLNAPRSWESEVVKKYNIEGLPLLCLIDSSGRMIKYDISIDSLLQDSRLEL